MELPFDGAISTFFTSDAPEEIRKAIKAADKGDILDGSYPHAERMDRKDYEREIEALQIELVKLQAWAKESGARVLGTGEPKIGAHGKPVLFLHPKDFNGCLVELEQV